MPRLNIYLPDDLAPLVERWRDRVNLSELCADALRDALDALETGRAVGPLLAHLAPASPTEKALARAFALTRAIVAEPASDDPDPRETVARAASEFLQRVLFDGITLAVGGGRQMWSIVRRMSARSLRVQLTAIGVEQVDPTVLHAHPNTLVTLLWLLYSPRATAHLVGASAFDSLARPPEPDGPDLRRVLIGSCAPFDPASSFSRLLGPDVVSHLTHRRARGDFLGVFVGRDGRPVAHPPAVPASLMSGDRLAHNARREDTLVVLAAAGAPKVRVIRAVLDARLCNTLITDATTARALLRPAGARSH